MKGFLKVILIATFILALTLPASATTCFWTACEKASGSVFKLSSGDVAPVVSDFQFIPATFETNTDFLIPLTKAGKTLYGKTAWGQGVNTVLLALPNYFTSVKAIDIQNVSGKPTNIAGVSATLDAIGALNKYIIGLKLPTGLVVFGGPALTTDMAHGFAPIADINFGVGGQF